MMLTKTQQRISTLTTILVFLLATGSFALSYNALWHVAIDSGHWPEQLAWIWPLLVDASLVIFSLGVLRASLLGERSRWTWTLTGLFTILTITFNVVPELLGPKVVAAVPPVALFLSFETFIGIVKANITRSETITTVDMIAGEQERLTKERDRLKKEVARLDDKREQLEDGPDIIERRQRVLAMYKSGDYTQQAMADKEQVSLSTIRRDLVALNGHKK